MTSPDIPSPELFAHNEQYVKNHEPVAYNTLPHKAVAVGGCLLAYLIASGTS
jgi:hypothetical protein